MEQLVALKEFLPCSNPPYTKPLGWVDATLRLKVVNCNVHLALEYWHTHLSGTSASMTYCTESMTDDTVPSTTSASSNFPLHGFGLISAMKVH